MSDMCLIRFLSELFLGRRKVRCSRFGLGVMGVTLAAGCAVRPAVPLSPHDPADPAAQESSSAAVSALLKASDSDRIGPEGMALVQPAMGGMDHQGHKPAPMKMPPGMNTDPVESYVCLMHPEVKSAEPGSCPICHMKLVKKEPDPPSPGAIN